VHAIESAPAHRLPNAIVEKKGTMQTSMVHSEVDRRLCPQVSCHLTGKEECGEGRTRMSAVEDAEGNATR
jgi:hypothetical protein